MAVAKREMIAAELIKQFRDLNDDFLARLRDRSDLVNNDVIKFNEVGADPVVLIDNSTYPINSSQRDDDNTPVSLKKLETENTIITDDELYALTYDKKSSVRESHMNALKSATIKLAAHALAPEEDDSDTPVIETTGEAVNGRLRLTPQDLVAFKERIDQLEIPMDGRILLLSSEHVNDLLLVDQVFRDRYSNTQSGRVLKSIYGFDVYESLHTPRFDSSLEKVAYGASFNPTDKNASVFFSTLNAFKAMGSVNMYYSDAATNPEMRESVVGFRMHYLVSPLSKKGIGAIVSAAD